MPSRAQQDVRTGSPMQRRHAIAAGYPFAAFTELQDALGIPAERLAAAVGIDRRLLRRRRTEGCFTAGKSDRLYRFQERLRLASGALEGPRAGAIWLTREMPVLEGSAPLEYAATEPGFQELLLILDGIAHDAFG